MPKLMQASVDEKNAAFDKVYPELLAMAERYSQLVNVPFVNVRQMVISKMQTPEFKAQVVQVISDALAAAEAVRDKAVTPPAA